VLRALAGCDDLCVGVNSAGGADRCYWPGSCRFGVPWQSALGFTDGDLAFCDLLRDHFEVRRQLIAVIGRAPAGRWWSERGRLPTTPAGVEKCAVMVFLGVRAVNLLQLAVTLPSALGHTTRPVLFTAALMGFTAESVLIAVATMRAGEYRDRRWGWADTAVAVLVLLVQPAFTTADDVTGDWTAWGFACTLSTATGAAIVFVRRREVSLAVTILMVCNTGDRPIGRASRAGRGNSAG